MSEHRVYARIIEAVQEAMDYADSRSGYESPGEWVTKERSTAERIEAIIREEMLQLETITAAHKGVPPPVQITRVLTNALNHVFGDPGGNKSDP